MRKSIIAISALTLAVIGITSAGMSVRKADAAIKISLKKGVYYVEGRGAMKKKDAPTETQKKRIKKIVIKKGITKIPAKAFMNCSKVTSVKLSEGLKEIKPAAFYKCSLKKVSVPKSVKAIGDSAFQCKSLKEINVPGNYEYINGFHRTNSIIGYGKVKRTVFTTPVEKNVLYTFDSEHFSFAKKESRFRFRDGVVYSKDIKELIMVASGVKKLKVAEECEVVDLYGIYGGEDLRIIKGKDLAEIVFPANVKMFKTSKSGSYASHNCKVVFEAESLSQELINKLVDKMHNNTNFIQGMIDAGYVKLKSGLLCGKYSGKNFEYTPDGNVVRGYYGKETKISIPDNVTYLESMWNGWGLEDIKIAPSVEKIDCSLYSETKVREVVIPATIKTLVESFANSEITKVKFENSFDVLPRYMFRNCFDLEEVELPKAVTRISEGAFENCSTLNVSKLLQNTNLRVLEKNAFYGAGKGEIVVPAHIQDIEDGCFGGNRWNKIDLKILSPTTKMSANAIAYSCSTKVYFPFEFSKTFSWLGGNFSLNKSKIKMDIYATDVNGAKGIHLQVFKDKKHTKKIFDKYCNPVKYSTQFKYKEAKKPGKFYVRIRPYRIVNNKKEYGKWFERELKVVKSKKA
ncbi:leucine-rich repeat domain-containing protein [Eubacterium xylanophilum]|uniref:leucine-rich repeat domain-containing protein n=1 Tax=Eubacterium xylanophilum TaxID=39497 RepID=UPI00047CD504|nr:leucine-rich repeat domain-containing protein [Eubacterium xylanophilum]